jgi:ABC-type Fe3+-siderophore transport system permease subunit
MALSSPPELANFIAAARQKGASDEALVSLLENAGWSRSEVWRVLGRHYETLTGVAIPQGNKSATPAKDAFLYLFSFSTLATWTFALASICFTLIDDWIKDPLSGPRYGSISYEISIGLACLIVTFPLYLFVMKVIVSDTRRTPEKLDSPVRKWLTYIALLIAASFMIGDLVTVLTYYLRGEVTARFVAKAAVTLIISSGVFWYYLGSLREAHKEAANAAH